METPTELDTRALPERIANRPNDPHHADTAPVGTGTEQPLVRVARGRGLEHSPLAKLPPELRNRIFEMALIQPTGINLRAGGVFNAPWGTMFFEDTCPPGKRIKSMCITTSWALRLMATCHQIRSEINNGLLSLNDINVHGVQLHKVEESYAVIPLLRRISSSLGLSSGRIVLWQNWNGYAVHGYRRVDTAVAPHAGRIPGLRHALSTYAQAIQPFQLFLGLSINYYYPGTGHGHLCKRDAPVTSIDSQRIQYIVPLGERMKAMKVVDEAIDGRMALLKRHVRHRLCPVRIILQNLESGLEMPRQNMRDVVDLVFEV